MPGFASIQFGTLVAQADCDGQAVIESTLMTILGCLDTGTSGRYLLEGHDKVWLDDDALAWIRNAKIGLIFQQFNLMRALRTAMSKLEAVGLGERANHRAAQLSGAFGVVGAWAIGYFAGWLAPMVAIFLGFYLALRHE